MDAHDVEIVVITTCDVCHGTGMKHEQSRAAFGFYCVACMSGKKQTLVTLAELKTLLERA